MSPHRSYANLWSPITPATAGPVAIPPRTTIGSPDGHLIVPGVGEDVGRHPDGRVGVIGHGRRRPGDGHVRVSDRLDLLEAVPRGDLVEVAEELIQGIGERLRG